MSQQKEASSSVAFPIKKTLKKNQQDKTSRGIVQPKVKHSASKTTVPDKVVQQKSSNRDVRPGGRGQVSDGDAIREILRDTKRGAARAELSGSWRPPTSKINSRLLNNALAQALQSNRRSSKRK